MMSSQSYKSDSHSAMAASVVSFGSWYKPSRIYMARMLLTLRFCRFASFRMSAIAYSGSLTVARLRFVDSMTYIFDFPLQRYGKELKRQRNWREIV